MDFIRKFQGQQPDNQQMHPQQYNNTYSQRDSKYGNDQDMQIKQIPFGLSKGYSQNGQTTDLNSSKSTDLMTDYKSENQKLKQKIRNLEEIIQNVQGFERSQSIIDFKNYIQHCQRKFGELIDELYEFKEKWNDERQKNGQLQQQIQEKRSSYSSSSQQADPIETKKLKQDNQDLQRQNEQLKLQIQELDKKLNQVSMYNELGDRKQLLEQIKGQNDTISQLSNEVDELTTKNNKYHEQLNKKDFFKEYDYMVREVAGLRQQNMKINEMIQQKNAEIAKLQGKEVPTQPLFIDMNR